MPGVRVKICGINSAAAYDAAQTADWVGFVFVATSPRVVTPQQAASLIQKGGPSPVGLFVEPSDADLASVLEVVPLNTLQLVATPQRVADIRARFGRPVWRAVAVAAAADLPATQEGADALLLDARPPDGAMLPGGNAMPFDWSVLHGWHPPGPWLLAGGLTPGTVAAAIRLTDAPAVDVSSGVESTRGVKDPARIVAFIQAAKANP